MNMPSERQRRLPHPTRTVQLVCGARATPGAADEDGLATARAAVAAACADAGLAEGALPRWIGAALYVTPTPQEAAAMHAALGLTGLPLTVLDRRGGPATWTAAQVVAGGGADCALLLALDGDGATCVVLGERETAAAMAPRPCGLTVATGVGPLATIADRARALAGGEAPTGPHDAVAGDRASDAGAEIQALQRALAAVQADGIDGSPRIVVDLRGDHAPTTVAIIAPPRRASGARG